MSLVSGTIAAPSRTMRSASQQRHLGAAEHVPPRGRSTPAIAFKVEDLPAPFAPSRTASSPRRR